ncbi:melanopsin-A-like [Littorina saxatilis]|uniref:melanopsin-A-like n=1 Tax=Littorina saxatilis TaxID=31220 RepID=UPI0038B4F081
MYNSLVFVFLLFLPVSAMTWLSAMVMLVFVVNRCTTLLSSLFLLFLPVSAMHDVALCHGDVSLCCHQMYNSLVFVVPACERYDVALCRHGDVSFCCQQMYNSLVFVFLLFLPVSAMTWLSVMVMKKLKTQIGTCSTHASATTVNGTNNGEDSHNNNNATHYQGAAIQARSLKIMVLTLVMFVLFWSPYGILSMMANFDIPIDDYVSAVPTIVAKSHCAINPIVYFVCFRHYRLSVRELFGMAES